MEEVDASTDYDNTERLSLPQKAVHRTWKTRGGSCSFCQEGQERLHTEGTLYAGS